MLQFLDSWDAKSIAILVMAIGGFVWVHAFIVKRDAEMSWLQHRFFAALFDDEFRNDQAAATRRFAKQLPTESDNGFWERYQKAIHQQYRQEHQSPAAGPMLYDLRRKATYKKPTREERMANEAEDIATKSGAVIPCRECGTHLVYAGDPSLEVYAFEQAAVAWKFGRFGTVRIEEINEAVGDVIEDAKCGCILCSDEAWEAVERRWVAKK